MSLSIFIINLKKDVNKKLHMQKLCDKYSLDYTFIEAIYGKELPRDIVSKIYNQEKAVKEIGRELTLGELGCALSHMKIYEKMVNENIENAIIFEDDISFDATILEAISSIKNFPTDWECVLLCYYRMAFYKKNYCINFRNRLQVGKRLKIVRFTALMHSTAAYVINQKGAKKLLSSMKEGIYKPVDHYTGDDQHVNLYGLYPKVVTIDSELGYNSTIALERNKLNTVSEDNGLRKTLKRIGLFTFFKKINQKRQTVQFCFERFLYLLLHFNDCIKKPKKYKNE